MTKAKRMLSLLLAVVMILSVIPFTASAAENDSDPSDEPSTGVNGLYMNKTVNAAHNELTLEAFVTGKSQTQITKVPVDVALVLDVSGSMDEEIEVAYGYDNLDKLDTVYGADEGIYIADFKGYLGDLIGDYTNYKLKYDSAAGQWQYYKKGFLGIASGWKVIGTNHYKITSIRISKLNAMKIAVKHFIDSANANSAPANPNRISVIKFAGKMNTSVGNDTYDEGSYTYNYSQIVADLTDLSTTNAETLKATVGALTEGGATQADFGMQHAQTVLSKTDSSRKKVVIMFTDGDPTSQKYFEADVANSAIGTAKALKDQNTTIYTVGCFASKPEDSSDKGKFMNYVSSNYPDATSLTFGGEKVKDAKYYSVATTSSELTDIFETISQETGGATYQLNSSAVVQDVISEYFELPANTTANDIKVYKEPFAGTNPDGSRKWGARQAFNEANVDVNVDTKTIRVTNFDFSENWVGFHISEEGDSTAHGCKLVIVIPIKEIKDKCWGNVPTNDAANSGIYVGENPVAPFPVPTVDYPYYEIVHVQMGENGQPVYTGDQSNKVIADPAAVNADNRVRITNTAATVDLTSLVPEHYLYGGSFSDPACTTAQTYANGETPASFHPQSGQTYYIWEAPDVYLIPRSLSLYKTTNDVLDVIGFYLLTGVDRLYYQSAGFDVTASNKAIAPITDIKTDDDGQLGNGTNVYSSLITRLTNGKEDKFEPGVGVFKNLKAKDSRLVCFTVPKDYWKNAGDTITFTPYWITLDGMKVTGTTTRTCKYQGPGYQSIGKVGDDSVGQSKITLFSNAAVQMMLTACGSVTLDGSENEPSAPVDPVDPIDPVDPVDPIDPVDPVTPVDPVEPAKQFSVTVHDGGSVYTLEAEAGEDITSRLVSAGMYGQLFAGWFLDERNTAAAELRNVQSDMDVYAKYVSDKFLTLRYRNVGLFRSRNVKLYAALDSADYAEAGFVINGQAVSCPITRDAYTAFFLFGSTVRENTTLVSCTYGTDGLRYGDTVEITPYWVTLDGTTVYGTTQTLTYGRFGLM